MSGVTEIIATEDEEIDLSDLEPEDETVPTRCAFLTGIAGSGKTYHVRELIAADRTEGVLCATTGIAAVNLGTTTINSLLKYFDTDSLMNAFINGRLTSRLAALAKQYRNIYVDEVSMMAAEQLDVLYRAVGEANRQKGVRKVRPEGLGIVVVGDMCQLPPIKARWIFEADCWPAFEANVTRLTHNWRQGEGEFLRAINLLRAGEGAEAAAALSATEVEFTGGLDLTFDGTTIMSKNDEVDRFNWNALRRLNAPSFTVNSKRWTVRGAHPPSEWKLIPAALELKVGAYVMVLANSPMSERTMLYCGKCQKETAPQYENMHRVQQGIRAANEMARLPKTRSQSSTDVQHGMSLQADSPKTREGLLVSDGRSENGELRELEGGLDSDKGRLRENLPAGTSKRSERVRSGASTSNGEIIGTVANSQRAGTPSQRNQARQSLGESSVDQSETAAFRGNRLPVLCSPIYDPLDCPNCGNRLSNRTVPHLSYANGDCGWVVEKPATAGSIKIKLARNGVVVDVIAVNRHRTEADYDEAGDGEGDGESDAVDRSVSTPTWGRVWWDKLSEKFVVGTVRYLPVRLAYASTVHKCVSYGTKIAVQGRGVIPIEQVQIGDWIDTGTGEFARLKATAHTEKLLYRITTAAGYSVVSSADHRWKTTEGMKEATKVVVGDLLQLAPPTIIDGTQAIDKETAWWIGATVGDANYSDKREGQVHFSGVVEFLRNRWMKTAQRLGGKPNTRRDKRGCHLTSLPLRLRLEMWGLDYVTSLSKRTPMVVFESGRVAWAAYLQGLFDTDGGIDSHRLVYCTRSPFLADDVQYLLLLLGIPSSRGTYTADYHGTEIEYYHVRITAAGLSRFKALIGFSSPEKVRLLAAWKPNRILRKFDGTDTVATITPLGVIGPVIDVELETVHELGFNGIVGSNSQGLTLDRVQLDIRNAFFGQPAMAYVALSRCRTARGLRIVGTEKLLAQRCKVDEKVRQWI